MKFFLKERLESARVDDVMSGRKVGDPGRTRRQEDVQIWRVRLL